MPWGVAAAVAGAVVTSAMAPSPSGSSGSASGAADPFASQRPQYMDQLNKMMTGSGFTPQDPSYQFRFNQGIDAVNAGEAAGGMNRSGNRMLALENYGQGAASTEYANQFSRLSQLAGANVGSPAAAGQIIAGQQQQAGQGASAVGNAVGSAVKGWGNQVGGYTPQTDNTQQYQTGTMSGTDYGSSGSGFTMASGWGGGA